MRYETRRAWAMLSVGLMAFLPGCGGDEVAVSDDPRSMGARDARAFDSQLVDVSSEPLAGDAANVGDASSDDRIRDVAPAESDASFGGALSDVIDVSVDPPPGADAISDVADASIDPPRIDADALADGGTADSGGCPGTTGGAIDLGRVVSDSANLYFIDRNVCAIKAVPKAGGTPVTLVQSTTPIHDMATDGSNFYFTTATAVQRCPLSGCAAPTNVVSVQGGDQIVTNGTNVYFTSGGKILKCSAGGCAAPDLFASTNVPAPDIVTDGSTLFWSDVASAPSDSGPSVGPALSSCPLAGCAGAPRSFYIGSYLASSLSTDGIALAWSARATSGSGIPETEIASSNIDPQTPSYFNYLATIPFTDVGPSFTGNGRTYLWNQSTIFFCATPGGCRRMASHFVVGDNAGPSVVASDANGFYWFERATSTFHQCPADGCNGTVVDAVPTPADHPPDVVASTSAVHWLGYSNALQTCSAADCGLTNNTEMSVEKTTFLTLSGLMANGPYRYVFERCGPGDSCYLLRSPTKLASAARIRGFAYGALSLELSLDNTPVETLQVTADGPFAFLPTASSGVQFGVIAQSAGSAPCRSQTSNGFIGSGDVNVVYSCIEDKRIIGGAVLGLEGEPVVLQNNGTDTVTVSTNGTFSFPTPLGPNADYNVTILTSPQFSGPCTVGSGTGKTTPPGSASNALDVTDIYVQCGYKREAGPRSSGLIADNQYLYWVQGGGEPVDGGTMPSDGAVVRMLLSGGPVETLASGIDGLGESSTALDANNLYFSALASGTIYKMPIAGGAVTPIATAQASPTSLVVVGTTLYWATATNIVSFDLASPGANPVSLAVSPAKAPFASPLTTIEPPRRLVHDNGYLYWVSIDDAFHDEVVRSGLHGENPTVLTSRQSDLGGGIAVTNGNVFFSGTKIALMSVPMP